MYKLLPTFHVLSQLSTLFGLLLFAPALVSYWYQDGLLGVHLFSAIGTSLISALVWIATRRFQRELHRRDGFTLVFSLWMGFSLLAAIPFYWAVPELDWVSAYFEASSGLTTTGATVISDLEHLAPSLNFWRHFLNWLGGMGIIVLAVAILPLLGVGGMQLFRAEISGINKGQKLAPRIMQTAKNMWMIYIFFTVMLFWALYLSGMSYFDAICHAMSTISLGGFSTHTQNIAYFNSVQIEIVIIAGMLLGAVSFTNHFSFFYNQNYTVYRKDLEIRSSSLILLFSIIFSIIAIWMHDTYNFSDSVRYIIFQFVSIGLSCGFNNIDYGHWPLGITLWMFLLSNILANSGSTGGGIKMMRVIILFKFMLREMMLLLHPSAVRTVKIDQVTVSERTALTVLAFIFVYFASVVLFTFVMMFSGLDFISSLSTIIGCITNSGQSFHVGMMNDWGTFNHFQKMICIFVMMIGRLEVFTVFILFTPAYWKK